MIVTLALFVMFLAVTGLGKAFMYWMAIQILRIYYLFKGYPFKLILSFMYEDIRRNRFYVMPYTFAWCSYGYIAGYFGFSKTKKGVAK